MSRGELTLIFILTNCIPITLTASSTCPLPVEAKTGDQTSVHVTVYFCFQRNETAETLCNFKMAEATLRKDLLTNLDHDINGCALMAKFYGREICTSYRIKILSRKIGSPIKSRTFCELDCFTGNKMVDFEYDYVCDNTGMKCYEDIQKLHFIVTFASHSYTIHSYGRTNLLKLGLVLIVWLIKY